MGQLVLPVTGLRLLVPIIAVGSMLISDQAWTCYNLWTMVLGSACTSVHVCGALLGTTCTRLVDPVVTSLLS